MTNEELVRNACQVIWTDGDVSRIGEFYAENFQANYPMTNWGAGLEGARNLVLEIRAAFPDYRERIDELIEAGVGLPRITDGLMGRGQIFEPWSSVLHG
jgi:hypothetical protein